jgi:hypothetical protein
MQSVSSDQFNFSFDLVMSTRQFLTFFFHKTHRRFGTVHEKEVCVDATHPYYVLESIHINICTFSI